MFGNRHLFKIDEVLLERLGGCGGYENNNDISLVTGLNFKSQYNVNEELDFIGDRVWTLREE